jgi:hypothetical protein
MSPEYKEDDLMQALNQEIHNQQQEFGGGSKLPYYKMEEGANSVKIVIDKVGRLAFTSGSHFQIKTAVGNKLIPTHCSFHTHMTGVKDKGKSEDCPICEVYFHLHSLAKKLAERGSEEEGKKYKEEAKNLFAATRTNVLVIPWDPIRDEATGGVQIMGITYSNWQKIIALTAKTHAAETSYYTELAPWIPKMIESGEISSNLDMQSIDRTASIFGTRHAKIITFVRTTTKGSGGFDKTEYKIMYQPSLHPVDRSILEEVPTLAEVFTGMYVDKDYLSYDAIAHSLRAYLAFKQDLNLHDDKLRNKINEAANRWEVVMNSRKSDKKDDDDVPELPEINAEDIGTISPIGSVTESKMSWEN